MDTKSRLLAAYSWGVGARGKWGATANGYDVSFQGEEDPLIGGGDGCTNLGIYQQNCTLQVGDYMVRGLCKLQLNKTVTEENATDVINSGFNKVFDGIVIIFCAKLSRKASVAQINYLYLKY